MMIELYTVKHIGNRIANEPRNVGVIATTGRGEHDRVAHRFLGYDVSGDFVLRPYRGAPKDVYIEWVNYFKRKTTTGRWDDIDRATRSRPQDFFLEHALTLLDRTDVERAADEYFVQLVTGAKQLNHGPAEQMRDVIDRIFSDLKLPASKDYTASARRNDRDVTVTFGYAFQGRFHKNLILGDQLPSRNLGQAGQAFAYRTGIASNSGISNMFVAFMDLRSAISDSELAVIESVAHVVDPMSDYECAVRAIHDLTFAS